MLHAKDVMTREVISIGPESTVLEAAELMLKNRISAVPVIADGRLVGILSEGDLVHRAEIGTAGHTPSWWLRLFKNPGALAEAYARSHSRRVADLMTGDVHTVSETTPVADAADLFDRARIKRVPVMRGDTVVGMLSRADLLKALVASGHEGGDAKPDDETIRARLLEEIGREPWATLSELNVEVKDGFVSFWGTAASEEERRATRVLAENLDGVKGVRDDRIVIDFPAYTL